MAIINNNPLPPEIVRCIITVKETKSPSPTQPMTTSPISTQSPSPTQPMTTSPISTQSPSPTQPMTTPPLTIQMPSLTQPTTQLLQQSNNNSSQIKLFIIVGGILVALLFCGLIAWFIRRKRK